MATADDRLKSLSKAIFGTDYVLPVAAEMMGSHEPLSLTELAARVGVSASSLQKSLRRLVAGGFVLQDAEGGSDRARPYRRVEGAFWLLVRELYAQTAGPGLF